MWLWMTLMWACIVAGLFLAATEKHLIVRDVVGGILNLAFVGLLAYIVFAINHK